MTYQSDSTGVQPPDDTSVEAPEPRTRRSFLGAAAAALGAVAIQSVASVPTVTASTGSTVKAGVETIATAVTTIANSHSASTAFKGYASSSTTSTSSVGVTGQSNAPSGTGVRGSASKSGGTGVVGKGSSRGVSGSASVENGTGVYGVADSGTNAWGVGGTSNTGKGVYGQSSGSAGTGVYGSASGGGGYGVRGSGRTGVAGTSSASDGHGIEGTSTGRGGIGVYSEATGVGGIALWGIARGAESQAGFFYGDVGVIGTVRADNISSSAGSVRMDHPLDPANRYLTHAFVESPEMLNVYSGSVTLDGKGRATVKLPRYFETLNMDHRYQLTAIGAAAPGLHIARKVEGNRFTIAGGPAGLEVSWQVTGVRQDAAARKHRIKVDTAKSAKDKGRYLDPEAFGKRRTAAIGYRKPLRAAKPEAHTTKALREPGGGPTDD